MKIKKLTIEEIREFQSPVVYLYVKQFIIIYVGRSKNGIGRLLDKNHQAAEVIAQSDEIILHICDSHEEACKLETIMIKEHKPKYNKSTDSQLKFYQGFKESEKEADKLISPIIKS